MPVLKLFDSTTISVSNKHHSIAKLNKQFWNPGTTNPLRSGQTMQGSLPKVGLRPQERTRPFSPGA